MILVNGPQLGDTLGVQDFRGPLLVALRRVLFTSRYTVP